MTNTVYVVMQQPEDDWGAGPRGPHAVFTDKDKAKEYVIARNEYIRGKPRRFHYWVEDDVELDPEPYEGETS